MRIQYLHHSGFCVRLPGLCMVFDYASGTFPIPEQEEALTVFVSHSHADHFKPEIFTLAQQFSRRAFVLSRDIGLSPARRARWRLEREQVLRLRPEEAAALGDISIHTLRSTDRGVAFVVEAKGKRIFHGGDLNWWAWPDDSAAEAAKMKERFFAALEPVRGMRFHAAFFPLDPRLGPNYALGLDAFMRMTNTEVVFPMHMWDTPEVLEQLRTDVLSIPYRARLADTRYLKEEITL